MVMHATADQTVGIEHAGEIFAAARHPKSFLSLDHADHLLSRKGDAAYAGNVIAAWAERYLDAPPEADSATEATEAGTVIVAETGAGQLQQAITAGPPRPPPDQPEPGRAATRGHVGRAV